MNCFLGVNSVSGLCLSRRDIALKLNCELNCVDGESRMRT